MKKKIIIGAIVGVLVIAGVIFLLLGSKKTYDVVFDSAGGTKIETQKVKEGDKVVKPKDPEKEGYEFLMWEYDGSEYDFSKEVKSDLKLTARYKELIVKHKVSITVDGKEEELEVETLTEADIEKLFPPKAGYELKLYADGKEYDISTPLTDDVVLTGKYEKVSSYTIKFDSSGGSSVASQTVTPNEKVKEPTGPTKEAYIFDGWYLNNNKYDFSTPVTKSFTLVAKWSEDPNVKRYNVTFDSDGGSKVASQRIIENKLVTKPSNPSRTGYTFVEWQLNGTTYDFKTKVTKDMTLKALWKEIKTYKVTFDSGVAEQKVNEGSKATKPKDPTKDGYIFIEWQLDGVKYDFTKGVTSDISLTAVWKRVVTVTFETNGGSNVNRQSLAEGEKATKPSNPTKEGYVFVEWQLDNSAYNFSTPVYDHITLTAVWKKEVTVTFDVNGGSGSIASQKIAEGSKATKPSNPTRSGYTFKEWQLNGQTFSFDTAITSDITLTAVWDEIVNYTVAVSAVDNYAPDRTLTVKRNGVATTDYAEIRSNDGSKLCGPRNPSVNASELIGQTTLKILLKDGREVVATIE